MQVARDVKLDRKTCCDAEDANTVAATPPGQPMLVEDTNVLSWRP